MKKLFKQLKKVFFNRKALIIEGAIFFIIFVIFTTNTLYVSYPDEFVNLLAGKFLNQGKIPYKEFFDHHLSFAWHFASLLLRFSFGSFVIFRLLFSTFIFACFFALALWIRKNYKEFYRYYLAFFFLYPLIAVYFWFHLYLADSLAAFFFSLIFWILMVQTLSKKINIRAIRISSFLIFFLIFSSMTYLYLAIFLYLWQLYLLFINKKSILKYILLSALPYVLYLIYILLIGAFQDFYFSNFVYNTEYYISLPNYTRGKFFNPLKFGLTLIHNFYSGYLPLLTKIKTLDLYLPIGILSGLGSFLLLILLIIRVPIIGIIFFFILSFSGPRSNVFETKETDYQSSIFYILGTISTFFAFYILRKVKANDRLISDLKRIVQVLLVIFFVFTSIFLMKNTYDKFFMRYTQIMPRIYDLSFTADFLDKILEEGDYYWAGPYEPHELFFVKKGRLPGKYISLLPQFRESQYLKQDFLRQFEENTPKLIVFKHEASVFNTPSTDFGEFFLDWIHERYVSLKDIEDVEVIQSPSSFKLKEDLYILNEEKDNVLKKLKDNNYIK